MLCSTYWIVAFLLLHPVHPPRLLPTQVTKLLLQVLYYLRCLYLGLLILVPQIICLGLLICSQNIGHLQVRTKLGLLTVLFLLFLGNV